MLNPNREYVFGNQEQVAVLDPNKEYSFGRDVQKLYNPSGPDLIDTATRNSGWTCWCNRWTQGSDRGRSRRFPAWQLFVAKLPNQPWFPRGSRISGTRSGNRTRCDPFGHRIKATQEHRRSCQDWNSFSRRCGFGYRGIVCSNIRRRRTRPDKRRNRNHRFIWWYVWWWTWCIGSKVVGQELSRRCRRRDDPTRSIKASRKQSSRGGWSRKL